MQFINTETQYDAIVVGSGAGGGMAVHELTRKGAKVLLLEAGGDFNPEDTDMFKANHSSMRRGSSTPERPFGEFDACYGGWNIEGEPYTKEQGTKFEWWRARMLGGRTNHWGRISLRFGPKDFKRKSIDGLGDNWPISYEDIKPWYDEVDKLVGIFGNMDGMDNEPDGIFMKPPPFRAYEHLVADSCKGMKIPAVSSRLSIITEQHNDRAPCHYCAQCNRGCSTHSNFSSPSVLLRPAIATGNITIQTNAMVREVLTDSEGLATGVSYVDTVSMKEFQVSAKVVILAASACSSARILLNSKSSRNPDGLANGSGVVGKYLNDTTGFSAYGIIPKLMGRKRYNEDGTGGMHVYTPWWLDNAKLDFPRGYHIEYWGGFGQPAYGFGSGIAELNGDHGFGERPNGKGGYGKQMKQDYRDFYGAFIGMSGRGEAVAFKTNYCEIDPDVVDKYGIPVLKFNYTWSEHELKQVQHMQTTFRGIIEGMGGTVLSNMPGKDQQYGITAPGQIIHELGTVRMGNDARSSALNSMCQAHECKNLFVLDGGSFVSQADKNPTWTILALSMRACDYIVKEMGNNNLS